MDDYGGDYGYDSGYMYAPPAASGYIDLSGYSWAGNNSAGGFDQYGAPSYTSPASDPYSMPTSDPASPWYTPPYNPASGIDPRSFPSGSGMYQVGAGQDWQGIYAPPSPVDYTNYRGDLPQGGSNRLPGYTGGASTVSPGGWQGPSPAGAWQSTPPRPASSPSGSGSSYTPQPMQRIALGAPERTLYDRYSKQLLDPSSMSGDPAYQFLYNQGEQALKRTLAAKRLTYSGKALNDTQSMGQGVAFNYMNQMLPQYQAGAREELARYMGPAGLLPSYAGVNNRATEAERSAAASRELLPYYQRMLDQSMGGGGPGAGIGYGGVSSGYTPQPRLEQQWGTQVRPTSPDPYTFDPYYDGYDAT